MTYPRIIITTWTMALLLACLLAYDMAHAGSFYLDVGAGATMFQRTIEDGTWIQDGLPHTTDFTSFAYRLGVGYAFNERYSLQANFLNMGIARIRAKVVHDPDYDPHAGRCLNQCANAFPFNTTDRMYGGELSLTRSFKYEHWTPFVRIGAAVMVHHLHADVQVGYPSPSNFAIDSKGVIPMGLAGLGLCYRQACLETTYYQGVGGSNGFQGMDYGNPIATSALVFIASVKVLAY